jgi:hypothetical protein
LSPLRLPVPPSRLSPNLDQILRIMRSANQVRLCPADSLQNNSNSLQRKSNITAAEFQQLQALCVSELFCSGRISPDFAGFRRK